MLQSTFSTNKIYNLNEHPRSQNSLLPNRQTHNLGYLNPGGSHSLPRNGTPRITPNYQSSQTVLLPKFQLTYHIQPHLQQFQQQIYIEDLNRNNQMNNNSIYSNTTTKQNQHLNSTQKRNYLLPINQQYIVSKLLTYFRSINCNLIDPRDLNLLNYNY